jgi:Cd2+/Zn2+-exporting ATPase
MILSALAAGKWSPIPLLSDVLMASAALLAGAEIGLRAFNSLRNRHISIELLVTIATVGALVIGEYWEAAAVTFLFIFGAYLEARTLSRTRRVLGELLDLAPATAIVVRDGAQIEVMSHEVQPGEHVLIKPGAKIPVDGKVLEGRSAVNESAITGESIPAEKSVGSPVFAGTVNQNGFIKVTATGIGADTTLARIIRRVEEAQDEKAPTQRFIERFARWYTPFIISLSLLAYLISRDIELALTLLVIGCPGALVISTPVSVISGIGRAAKAGILVKGGEYLENAGKITALALDKTGTLTHGKPRLTNVIPLFPILQPAVPVALYTTAGASPDEGSSIHENSFAIQPTHPLEVTYSGWTAEQSRVIYLAAIAESHSEHPLAGAILEAAQGQGSIPSPDEFETYTGRGISARHDGHSIHVGTPAFLQDLGIAIQGETIHALDSLKTDGKTAVLVVRDAEIIGILGIADTIRPDALAVIQKLKAIGLKKIVMLTGDDRRTAEAIARQVGLEHFEAELLPEDKLDAIRELQQEGHIVAMVGDGINDAPALAAADIGIAMGAAGTDVAIETADIALMADDLSKIPEAIRISKSTLINIRQNVAIALLTVTGLLLGVLLGRVHMAGGMLVHEASVLIVILNGMRLLRK